MYVRKKVFRFIKACVRQNLRKNPFINPSQGKIVCTCISTPTPRKHHIWRLQRLVPSRAFTRHHGEFLRYGNSFPSTFPEVLLAHTSQWLANCREACDRMQILTSSRQYKMRSPWQLRQNLFLHFAEQPRFMAYKLLQLTVEVRSSEGGLCMAAPLQRSGEYDVFSSDESICPQSSVDLDSGDELMPTKCPHFSHPSNLQDRTSARLLTSPFHGGAESRVQIPELMVPMSPQMPHGPLSKHTAPPP